MNKKCCIYVFAILFFIFKDAKCQELQTDLNLKNISGKNSSLTAYKTAAILFPLNPIFLVEDKKFYVGITKEISIGKFPYGRAAFEYSLIFRKTRVNHIRLSYNFDIPLPSGDLAVVLVSFGGGYFTDFDKKGYFPQTSLNILIPVDDNNIGINTYTRFRYTFMTDKSRSDIFDFSLGLGTVIYF